MFVDNVLHVIVLRYILFHMPCYKMSMKTDPESVLLRNAVDL